MFSIPESQDKVRTLKIRMQRLLNILSPGVIQSQDRAEWSSHFFIQYQSWTPVSQVHSPWGGPGQNLL